MYLKEIGSIALLVELGSHHPGVRTVSIPSA